MELFQTHFWLRSQGYGHQILLHFEVRMQPSYAGLAKELCWDWL